MVLGFTGEHHQKVDGKGRMSVPADFRRVLEAEDPDWSPGQTPRAMLVYGKHLKNLLQVYSVQEFASIRENIYAMKRGSKERAMLQGLILGSSAKLDVDKDGRVVMPLKHREKLGLSEGELVFRGMGEFFEIWKAETYEAEVGSKVDDWLAEMPDDFDPMSMLDT